MRRMHFAIEKEKKKSEGVRLNVQRRKGKEREKNRE